jgi:hypothetical protein
MRNIFTVVISFLTITTAYSQNTEVLTNKSVKDLTMAGMSSKIIINKINNSTCNFITITDSLISLKKSGVSEEVIEAMVNKLPSAAGQTVSNSNAGSNVSVSENENIKPLSGISAQSLITSLQKEGSGIYYILPSDNSIIEAEPTVFSQEKSGSNYWASYWSYGFAKSKKVMSVSGSKANIQFNIKRPYFYFYFDPQQNSLNAQSSSWYANATNPNEFLLVKFNTKVKNSRAVATASQNYYEYASGVDDEFKVSYKFQKLAKGIYEVYFEEDLLPGEYGFMYAGTISNTSGSPKVYDFGISK